MLVDPSRSLAVSNLGWVDRGSFWLYTASTRASRSVRLGDADFLRLYPGAGDRLAISQHGQGNSFEVSVHAFADLERQLAVARFRDGRFEVDGQVSEFAAVPNVYVSYFDSDLDGVGGYYLIQLSDTPRVRRLDWFDNDQYDHGYQSVMSVVALDGVGTVFTVQRSSDLVVCDPVTLGVTRTVPLSTGRYGNPSLRLIAPDGRPTRWGRKPHRPTLIADDYDAVLTLDPTTLEVRRVWEGQPPIGGSRMFIGSLGSALASDSVLVPRPGQGDVVELRVRDLSVVRTWTTGAKPLVAAEFPDHLVARDWKSGDLLTAE